MATRSRAIVRSLRVSEGDDALIRAYAAIQEVSVSQALREVVIKSVRDRLAALVSAPAQNDE